LIFKFFFPQLISGLLIKRLDNTYMFFHPSFREWLMWREDSESKKFVCDLRSVIDPFSIFPYIWFEFLYWNDISLNLYILTIKKKTLFKQNKIHKNIFSELNYFNWIRYKIIIIPFLKFSIQSTSTCVEIYTQHLLI